jgi:putative membrane protein insertion efficiency factor
VFRHFFLSLIDFYRKGISVFTPPSCRFTPSCSSYAYQAVERFGVTRGGWMFLNRLARCRPFGGKGYDPVPSNNTVRRAGGDAG